jgi:sulfite reductase (ferredoxin)
MEEWGPERFRQELESRLGRKLTDGASPRVPVSANRAHLGVHRQKNPGLFYVGAATRGGLLPGSKMIEVARLAKRYGGGRVRLTTTQNLILLDVPESGVSELVAGLESLDLQVSPSSFRTGTIACTGKQFCKLALTETKDRASELIDHLESALPRFREPLRISVTGCPNSCAHYQVCDIGFVGDFLNTPEGKIEAYRVYLGGHLGDGYAFGRELDKKIPATEIKYYVEAVARQFLSERLSEHESFQKFIARQTPEELGRLGTIEQVEALV